MSSSAQRKAQREGRAAAYFAGHGDGPVELFDDALGDRQAQAESAALGGDEVVEDGGEPLRRNARTGVGDGDLHLIGDTRGGDRHLAARGAVA